MQEQNEMLELIESLEGKAELVAFGEETLGLKFGSRDTVEQIKQKLIDAATGKQPEQQAQSEAKQDQENKTQDRPRMLKHKVNGRVFVWSDRLAKNKNMIEV